MRVLGRRVKLRRIGSWCSPMRDHGRLGAEHGGAASVVRSRLPDRQGVVRRDGIALSAVPDHGCGAQCMSGGFGPGVRSRGRARVLRTPGRADRVTGSQMIVDRGRDRRRGQLRGHFSATHTQIFEKHR